MRVLMICGLPPLPLPEADHAFHLVQHLAEAGVTLDVLTAKGSAEAAHVNVAQHSIMEHWNWREAPRLLRQVKRSRPDVIFLYYFPHLYDDHPMITFVPTLMSAFASGIPVIVLFPQFYGSSDRKFGLSGKLVNRAMMLLFGKHTNRAFGTLLRDSRRIIALSRLHLQKFVDCWPQVAGKALLIPPPPIMVLSEDTDQVRSAGRSQLGAAPETFLFAYFGYLYPSKGVETLIRAFSLIVAEQDTARLAVIGSVSQFEGGPEYAAALQHLVKSLGLEDKIVFTGKFDWDSPQGSVYLRAADACVLPFDGGVQMNNSSFAAVISHGLPVITTAGPDPEEQFVDGENVCLCPPADPEALAAAMRRVMDEPEFRRRLHQGALRLSDEWFSWNSATRRTKAALESVSV